MAVQNVTLLATMLSFIYVLLLKECISGGCGAEDVSITIEKKCGVAYSIPIRYDSSDRDFFIYIPSILCDESKFLDYMNSSFNPNNNYNYNSVTLPILISIHCLGCNAMGEMNKWIEYSEKFNLILISPSGIDNSWNADQCCDPSAKNGVDDLGFIQTILYSLRSSFSDKFPFIALSNTNNKDGFVFITGFSNGGFMSDKIGWSSSAKQFQTVVAVAPTAGYIYDNMKYIQNSVKNKDKHRHVAMYLHHSMSDSMVKPDGCCKDTKRSDKCCCGISDKSDNCLSIKDEYKNWLTWNGCNDDITFDTISTAINPKLICADATPEEHGCNAFTSLCLHADTPHTSWSRDFPQTHEVILFFLKSLCSSQNGIWNTDDIQCECGDDIRYDGLYCITPKDILGININNIKYNEIRKYKGNMMDLMNDNKNILNQNGTTLDAETITKSTNKIGIETRMKIQHNQMNDDVTMNKEEDNDNVEAIDEHKVYKNKRRNKDLSIIGSANNKYIVDDVNDAKSLTGSWRSTPNISTLIAIVIIFGIVIVFIIYKKKKAGYLYSKVNINEEESLNLTPTNT